MYNNGITIFPLFLCIKTNNNRVISVLFQPILQFQQIYYFVQAYKSQWSGSGEKAFAIFI